MSDMMTGLKYLLNNTICLLGMKNANILITSVYRATLGNFGVGGKTKELLKRFSVFEMNLLKDGLTGLKYLLNNKVVFSA